jgi:hypothetical protein
MTDAELMLQIPILHLVLTILGGIFCAINFFFWMSEGYRWKRRADERIQKIFDTHRDMIKMGDEHCSRRQKEIMHLIEEKVPSLVRDKASL